jgi:uroporphyrinogen-III decarboxylase
MRELSLRVKVKEEARVMENAFMVQGNLIENLLASSDARIRRDTCTVMGTLASSSESTPWYLDVCAQIVSLLR